MNVLNHRRKEMKTAIRISTVAAVALALGSCGGMPWDERPMSFFVTSAGSGKGADVGGLAGADKLCQSFAAAAGAFANARGQDALQKYPQIAHWLAAAPAGSAGTPSGDQG